MRSVRIDPAQIVYSEVFEVQLGMWHFGGYLPTQTTSTVLDKYHLIAYCKTYICIYCTYTDMCTRIYKPNIYTNS